jgi:invasion protein IalB
MRVGIVMFTASPSYIRVLKNQETRDAESQRLTERRRVGFKLNLPGFGGHLKSFDGYSKQEVSNAQTRTAEVQ